MALHQSQMNWKIGLWRVWIVLAAFYLMACCFLLFGPVRQEFSNSSRTEELLSGSQRTWPLVCQSARGVEVQDYLKVPSGGREFCFYDRAGFRRLFPEHSQTPDSLLARRLWTQAGDPLGEFRPWEKLQSMILIAVGPPFALLLFGIATLWAFRGFQENKK